MATNTNETNLEPVEVIGHMRADQLTADNIEDFAKSLNGRLEEGILVFEVHNWTHRAIIGDWIVVFLPSGDLLTFTDKFFKRNFGSVENELTTVG